MLQGGTRSGKTRAIMDYIIAFCLKYSGIEIDICRAEFATLRGTAYLEFKQLLILLKIPHELNKSENIIIINDNRISFYGLDNDEKVHGKERDILWVNEINQIKQEVFDQLTPRTRYRIIGDYNPRLGRKHWLDKYIHDFPPIITTYLDNPFLPDIQVRDIESKRDNVYWWSIYGEGKRAAMQGAIFENWEIGEFDNTLQYCYGQDFGFNPDPTVLVKVAVDKSKKIIYVHECFYNSNQLTTDQIYQLNKSYILRSNDLIVADSAEPRLIHEVAAKGLNIQKTTKGAGSVLYGINKMLEYKIIITPESVNLETELNNYIWNDKKAGLPIDKQNHCFTADTLITTNKGHKKIIDIDVNDMVLTTKGYRNVLKKFNNGVKETYKYTLLFDTFSLSLQCTKDHKIKTEKGWMEISKLSKEIIYLHASSTVKNIDYTQMKGILVGEQKDYIGLFGSFIKVLFQKVMTFIILMKTPKTMILIIWHWLGDLYTKDLQVKKDLKTIRSYFQNFIKLVLKRQKNGINQLKELNGIKNTPKDLILVIKSLVKKNVVYVVQNILQILRGKNFAQTNVNRNLEETKDLITLKKNVQCVQENILQINIQEHKLVGVYVERLEDQKVYDLMIDECHEYFANGVLVHNCIDSLRYAFARLTATSINTSAVGSPQLF